MQETKLYKLLLSFSHPERQRFTDFLNSVYFNQRLELIQLFEIIKPSLNITKRVVLTEEEIWLKLFKNKHLNKVKFHRICSDLLKQAERFLAFYQFSHNQIYQELLTVHALNAKKVMGNVSYSLHQIKKSLDNIKLKESNHFYYQQLYEIEHKQYNEIEKRWVDEVNLKRIDANLDIYFIIQKLQHCSALIHYRRTNLLPEDVSFITQILEKVENEKLFNIDVVKLQYLIIKTQIEPQNTQYFDQLKSFLLNNELTFSRALLRDSFVLTTQFCIKKLNLGENQFASELFFLYDYMMNHKLITDSKGEISPWEFKNIITLSIKQNEIEWTEDFINRFGPKINIDQRENAIIFNSAKLKFAKQDYQGVFRLLQDVKYNDNFYLLNSKSMLIKALYEMKEYSTLSDLLDSFSLMLRRNNKIDKKNGAYYNNLIKYTRQISKAESLAKLRQIEEKLLSHTDVSDLAWLKQKLIEKMNSRLRNSKFN
jgi:hypothetical protein